MVKNYKKPNLFNKGHVLYITHSFLSATNGSSVVNRNLLDCFDPNSYTVITQANFGQKIKEESDYRIIKVILRFKFLGKYNRNLIQMQKPIAKWLTKRVARRKNSKLIIATNPDIYSLNLAKEVASEMHLPLIPYLHDTIFEAYAGSKYENFALEVQNKIFNYSDILFVISDGLKDLYLRKYNKSSIVIRHTYHDIFVRATNIMGTISRIFWSGGIYDINSSTLRHVSNLIAGTNLKLEITSNRTTDSLMQLGLNFSNIELNFYPKRTEYLEAIQRSDLLLIVLDRNEYSKTHIDELSTIFPTKTLDYFASGKPILLICPEDYFLSKFFTVHDCGFVFHNIETLEDLKNAIQIIENDTVGINRKKLNGYNLLDTYFRHSVIQKHMIDSLINL